MRLVLKLRVGNKTQCLNLGNGFQVTDLHNISCTRVNKITREGLIPVSYPMLK